MKRSTGWNDRLESRRRSRRTPRNVRPVALSLVLAGALGLATSCGGGGGGGGDPPDLPSLPPLAHASVLETAGMITVPVGRMQGKVGAISVTYATSDGTALAGQDYTETTGTLDWADGDDAPKNIVIPILNDMLVEGDEQFRVTLSVPTGGATLWGDTQILVEIEDDETPGSATCQPSSPSCTMLAFELDESSVEETVGTAQVRVLRRGATTGMVQVMVESTGGTATSGADYTPVMTMLTWADGDSSPKTVNVVIQNDTAVEPDETVVLSLLSPTRTPTGCIEVCTPHTLTIEANDGPGSIVFFDPVCVGEDEGTAQIPVGRAGGSMGAVSVAYMTMDGTATSPADFQATSGTLNWANGDDAPKFIPVSIVNDAVTDLLEDFTIQFSGVTGGATLPDATMNVTIVQGRVFTRPNTVQATECDGFVALKLTVQCDSILPGEGISYSTSNGTAMAGQDYVADSGMAIVDFDGTAEVFIQLLDDGLVEGNETFNIMTGTGGAGPTVVTIVDDDPTGTIECEESEVTFAEGAGAQQLLVVRGPCVGPAASVNWALVDGTAAAGSDYSAPLLSGTFSWAAGDLTDRTVSVNILGDMLPEPTESFFLRLTGPTGAILGTNTQTRVDIIDDDGPGCVGFL